MFQQDITGDVQPTGPFSWVGAVAQVGVRGSDALAVRPPDIRSRGVFRHAEELIGVGVTEVAETLVAHRPMRRVTVARRHAKDQCAVACE